MRATIKQDLNQDLNIIDYDRWSVLEKKTNAISHPNIGLLKTAIEEEWNKISEELILKMMVILRTFTISCQPSYIYIYVVELTGSFSFGLVINLGEGKP